MQAYNLVLCFIVELKGKHYILYIVMVAAIIHSGITMYVCISMYIYIVKNYSSGFHYPNLFDYMNQCYTCVFNNIHVYIVLNFEKNIL